MTITALTLSLALQAQAVDRPSVKYYQDAFEIRSHGRVSSVPLKVPMKEAPKFVAFRKNDSFAVWDERGLTIRRGAKAISSHLPEMAVSPKLFSRDEILKTVDLVRSGDRTKDAAGLSGAKRIGKDVYFLVRWEDKAGKPWAEALVQVDLTASKLRPQLLGRFVGLSSATKLVDDKIEIVHGKLTIVEHNGNSWGLSTFDPSTQEFLTRPMGGTLVSFETLNVNQGLFVETSAYGTTIAGRVDIDLGTRKILYEGREQVRFVDAESPEVVIAAAGKRTKVINCVTGGVRLIPYTIDARRIGNQLLIWSTPDSPKAVWLMALATWETLATWRAP